MELIQMKCPGCGAMLEVENGLDSFYCKYCGSKIMLDGQSDAAYMAKAQIKESEHSLEKLKAKLQHEERMQKEDNENSAKSIWQFIMIYGLIILIIVLFFSCSKFGSNSEAKKLEKIVVEVQQLIEDEKYEEALIKADSIRYTSDYSSDEEAAWNERRATLINLIKGKMAKNSEKSGLVVLNRGSEDYIGMNYLDAMDSFSMMGFNDVSSKQLNEKGGFFEDKDAVKKITIDGDDTFSENDVFNNNAKVVVYICKQ